MLRACIFDNKKALILSKTFRTKRAFAIKFGNNKARSLVKVATETSAKSFEFWRFSSLYSFFDRIKLNPISMRNRIPQSMPYILEERKAPKGFEKFLKDVKQKKEEKQKEEEAAEPEKPNKEESKSNEKEKEKEESEEEYDQKGKSSEEGKEADNREWYMRFLFNPNNNPKFENWGILALVMFGLIYAFTYKKPAKELVYMEFVNDYLTKNRVKNITIVKDKRSDVFNYRAEILTQEGDKFYITLGSVDNFLAKIDLIQREMGKTPQEFIPLKYSNESDQVSSNLALNMIIASMFGLFMWQIFKSRKGSGFPGSRKTTSTKKSDSSGFMGGGFSSMMNVGKSNATVYGIDKNVKTRFKHVAGLDNAKLEIMEFVDFLKDPKKYQKLGAKIPRGALLIGPPGTGKTLLAKATAGEAKIPFLSISGSDFVEMFVGVGASRVRDLFKKARENAPSIIFIDEIDAVGKKRHGKFTGGNDERDSTLNQLLVEMDGFGTDSSVVVLAATNRKDILDSALLRPGRFDRTIEITLPNIKERAEIFKVHLNKIKLNPKFTMEDYARKLAALTPGMSGADIHNVVNEGAILAARRNLESVGLVDFESATERVIGGLEKKTVMSQQERETVAYHESGHAVAGWFLENSNPLLKITIVPRTKGSLGFAQYLPEELSLYTKEQLVDMIKVALGGRVAEEIFFGRITTGASDDLKKTTQIATGIVTVYGMNKNIGMLNYYQEEGYQKPYSEETGGKIDREVKEIIDNAYTEVKQLLESKRTLIENLAKRLLEKEVVALPDLLEILGERPWPLKENVKEYLQEIKERAKEEQEAAAKAQDEKLEKQKAEEEKEKENENEEKH